MPSYYYVGHFSKFIRPKAIQVESSGTDKLLYVSFINQDGSQVLVVQNQTDEDLNIDVEGLKENIRVTIEKHSISTFII